jgi:hypothetical protein
MAKKVRTPKMMDGHDNIRFPGPGIDLIHHEVAVNLFQVVNGEDVLLETLNFSGRMLIKRGKAYTNSDGYRQVDFVALAWTATAWSKSLKKDILYILSEDVEQPISNIIVETKAKDFPATIQFDLIFDVRINNHTIIRKHKGRPKGHKFLTIPPASDVRTELTPVVSLFGHDDILHVGIGTSERGEMIFRITRRHRSSTKADSSCSASFLSTATTKPGRRWSHLRISAEARQRKFHRTCSMKFRTSRMSA